MLQVCKDYEERKLFFSKEVEMKWKKKARTANLDQTVDESERRRKMVQSWFRPLTKVSRENYIRLAKQMEATNVIEGRRESQKYYFNGTISKIPVKGTLSYVVDRLQRKDVVRNQIQFLMVQAGDETPSSMEEFFAIDTSRYGGDQGRQFMMMRQTLMKDSKTLWNAPIVKGVPSLRSFEHLISVVVKQHFEDI